MGLGDVIKERNKRYEQIISSHNNNIVRKILQIFWIDFMSLVVEQNNEIFNENSWDLFCSVSRSECNHISFLFLFSLLLILFHNMLSTISIIHIFMIIVVTLVVVIIVLVIMVVDMIIKEISNILSQKVKQ